MALALALGLGGCGLGGSSDSPTTARTTPTTTAPPRAAAPARPPRAEGELPSAAEQADAIRHDASLGRPVYCGGRRGKLVALTFDDGPGPYTQIVLRELRKANMRATFFLVGASIKRFPQSPRREAELGAIGNHSMTHPHLSSLSLHAAMAEIQNGRKAAREASGADVDVFRPPYGGHNDAIDREVGRDGMAQILWDVDSVDSRRSPPADFHEISAEVRRNMRPGSIVLMHENRGQTIRALRAILPWMKRRGLRSVTVPELLAADPPSRAQLEAGPRGCGRAAGARGARPRARDGAQSSR